MDQIPCLQPKELVAVSFLKDISTFFLDSIINHESEPNTLKKDINSIPTQDASQRKTFEKINFQIYHHERL